MNEERFREYDRENPKIWELFKRFSEEVLNAGYSRYSAYAIFERIRWHTDVETKGDPFKVNNNYRRFYSQKLMEEDSRFEGFFRCRTGAKSA